MNLPALYCKISKENDFEIWEDPDRGGISILIKGKISSEPYRFAKRSRAIKFITEMMDAGYKLNSNYPLEVLHEDLKELGEMAGLPKKGESVDFSKDF